VNGPTFHPSEVDPLNVPRQPEALAVDVPMSLPHLAHVDMAIALTASAGTRASTGARIKRDDGELG